LIAPVVVVIVNFNGAAHLPACLNALNQQSLTHSVMVVDNASTDGSARTIRDISPGVRLLSLRRNVGFARAVNIAASRIEHPEAIMVTLNPDTVPRHDFLEKLTSVLQDRPTVGAAAGTLVFSSDPSVIASAGIQVHRNGVALDARLGERWVSGEAHQVFGASGGAAAYRVSAFRDAGCFPDHYFLYLEDVDLAWRMRLRGWDTLAVPDAVATHLYSASAVEGSRLKRRMLSRNRIWTMARCLPTELWERDRLSIIGFDTLAVGHAIMLRDTATIRGRTEGIAGLPVRLRERKIIQSRTRVDTVTVSDWVLPAASPARLLKLRNLTSQLSGAAGGS
jgi:GT2 family glycosyltransferase